MLGDEKRVGLFGHLDPALPPGPEPRHCRKQQPPVHALLAVYHQPSARPDLDLGLAQPEPTLHILSARITADRDRLQADPLILRAALQINRQAVLFNAVHLDKGIPEDGNALQCRLPAGDRAEIVDIPAQRRIDLIEGADGHHQPTEGEVAGKINRRRDQDRRHHRQPAIPCRDPCEMRQRHGKAPDDAEHRVNIDTDPTPFVLLTARKGNGGKIFARPHQ
ncbi:hypothetical protein D3C86_1177380 [compost metagenome]